MDTIDELRIKLQTAIRAVLQIRNEWGTISWWTHSPEAKLAREVLSWAADQPVESFALQSTKEDEIINRIADRIQTGLDHEMGALTIARSIVACLKTSI